MYFILLALTSSLFVFGDHVACQSGVILSFYATNFASSSSIVEGENVIVACQVQVNSQEFIVGQDTLLIEKWSNEGTYTELASLTDADDPNKPLVTWLDNVLRIYIYGISKYDGGKYQCFAGRPNNGGSTSVGHRAITVDVLYPASGLPVCETSPTINTDLILYSGDEITLQWYSTKTRLTSPITAPLPAAVGIEVIATIVVVIIIIIAIIIIILFIVKSGRCASILNSNKDDSRTENVPLEAGHNNGKVVIEDHSHDNPAVDVNHVLSPNGGQLYAVVQKNTPARESSASGDISKVYPVAPEYPRPEKTRQSSDGDLYANAGMVHEASGESPDNPSSNSAARKDTAGISSENLRTENVSLDAGHNNGKVVVQDHSHDNPAVDANHVLSPNGGQLYAVVQKNTPARESSTSGDTSKVYPVAPEYPRPEKTRQSAGDLYANAGIAHEASGESPDNPSSNSAAQKDTADISFEKSNDGDASGMSLYANPSDPVDDSQIGTMRKQEDPEMALYANASEVIPDNSHMPAPSEAPPAPPAMAHTPGLEYADIDIARPASLGANGRVDIISNEDHVYASVK